MAKTFNKKNWIISALRRSTMRYPPANNARGRTKETYYIKSKKGKDLKRVKFTCEMCGKRDLKSKEMNLHHKVPVIDETKGFTNWDDYINRMFCEAEDFVYICEACHDKEHPKKTKKIKEKA